MGQKSAYDGDRVRERDERLDGTAPAVGADGALLDAAVVPGAGALDNPAGAGSTPFGRGVPSSLAT